MNKEMRLRLKANTDDLNFLANNDLELDTNINKFYLKNINNVLKFKDWIPVNDFNVLAENLYLFEITRTCWKCHKETKCVCIGSNSCFIVEDSSVRHSQDLMLFSYLKGVPGKLTRYLEHNCNYKFGYSKKINDSYFLNHCSHCGAAQGDYYLHEYPETSFYASLCYNNAKPLKYAQFLNKYIVPISGRLPCYDEVCYSISVMLTHMLSGIENRASLEISQSKVNTLLSKAQKTEDIVL